MNFYYKFRRLGSVIIDFSITQMFVKLILGMINKIITVEGIYNSLGATSTFFFLFGVSLIYLLIVIGTYMLYHYLSFRLLGDSLTRTLLRLSVVDFNSEEELEVNRYVTREYRKITLIVATLGLYSLYSGLRLFAYNEAPYHDKKNHTKVISKI